MSKFLEALNARKGNRTLAEMGQELGLSPSALSRILRGHGLSSDSLRLILKVYPDLYPIWLEDSSSGSSAAAA